MGCAKARRHPGSSWIGDALEYLELIKRHPKHIGPQVQWTDFPSDAKARADLVLRFEDISDWETRIRSAGVDAGNREIPYIGKSGNKRDVSFGDVGLSQKGFQELKERLREDYREDFIAFGYEID